MVVSRFIPPQLRDHPVQWRTASPLWRSQVVPADPTYFLRPAILRFTSDRFMDDFLAIATQAPQRLGEWQAVQETWRKPAPVPPLPPLASELSQFTPDAELASQPLKLYQPANQRYYLVVANLVCRLPGLPDRALKTQNQEKATFVLRRFLTHNGNRQEHALIGGVWQPLTSAQTESLLPAEEEFPLFPVTYRDDRAYSRRLWAGLIPVSARERFLNAGRQPTAAIAATLGANLGGNPTDEASLQRLGAAIAQLTIVFEMDVLAPWSNLLRTYGQERGKLTLDLLAQLDNTVKRQNVIDDVNQARDRLQVSSWYALLDFAYFLRDRLPAVWARILTPNSPLPPTQPEKNLVATLESVGFAPAIAADNPTVALNLPALVAKLEGILTRPANPTITLAQALRNTYAARIFLETTTLTYRQGDSQWPTSRFLLCGKKNNPSGTAVYLLEIETLKTLVSAALTASPPDLTKAIPLIPEATQIADSTQADDYENDQFIIRCTYQRPHCPPSLRPTVVSEATIPFQMASYYDPDAPARPIRIPMPIDTSPAGLRKFAKNTAFVLSDSLACQVEKARALTFGDLVLSVLPWPFHKSFDTNAGGCPNGRLSLGKICTLSIPIITICALILLIIIVQLLDIIFRWVPLLIFCLPLPLKGKEDN